MIERVSQGALAVAASYGYSDVGTFITSHVAELKRQENEVAVRCGEVLERLWIGFGVGADYSLTLIAVGRC